MLALALCLALLPVASEQGWPKPDERITCGPLVLEVYVSRTAHVFHVVDQIAAWDNSCHGQYREHMQLSAEDETALRAYAGVREKRRWGQGLEQTFYVPLDLDQAIRAGVRAGNLTDDEARVIRPVLERFAPRAEELLASKKQLVEHAFAKIDRARLARAAEELARFTGVKKLTVPAFPLASPTPGGGAMDGGRLRWEVGSEDVSFQVLLHELTHGFFMQRNELLEAMVSKTPGLTMTLLGEGFAYAMAPGLYPDGAEDNLAYNVAKDRAGDVAWKDDGPGRFREYALGLRPLFKEALAGGTLEAFLPRARDVYLALREIEEAHADRGGPPRLAVAGPAREIVRERLLNSKFSHWIDIFNHNAPSYLDVLPKLGENDLFVLLVAGDDSERIPSQYASLSPVALDEIERRLAKGVTIAEAGSGTKPRVVLLAAPNLSALRELARTSKLLED